MKGFIRLIILAHMLGFSLSHILFPLQNRSSTNLNSVPEEKYSEYFNKGEDFKIQGEYQKSIEFFRKALYLAKENNDKKSELESLTKLGVLYWNIGKLDECIDIYNEALSVAEKAEIDEKKEEVLDFIKIHEFYQAGKEYYSQGEHKKSIENYERAIALARKTKSEEHEVKCLRGQSITYFALNDIDKFFSLNKEALKIAGKLKHKQEEGRCLSNIGYYYSEIDNYSQALLHYEEALRIARIVKDYDDESECLTNISEIYIQVGNYEKALEYLKNVLKIDQEELKEDFYVAIDLNNIGVTYQKKALHSGNKDDLYNALANYEKSLKIARRNKYVKTEIEILNNMGMVYKDLENYPEALRYFNLGLEKAEQTQDNEEIANILVNIGVVYSKQEDNDLSIKYFHKAIDTASRIRGERILWEAYFEIANAYMKQGDYQMSLENYKKSVSHLENIRSRIQLEKLKASYLGTYKRIDTYYNLIDLLVKLDQSEPEKRYNTEAFQYMEKARARAFLDSLEVSQINISEGIDSGIFNQENELMKDITSLNSKLLTPGLSLEQTKNLNDQLKLCEERLEALKREIRMSSPAYADLKYPEIISVEKTQKQILDNKTAFFEFCLGRKNSYVFVITKRKFKIFSLPPAKKIQEQVRKYLKAITDKDNHDFRLGYELFSALVLPGLDEKVEKLFFIPDDILHYLPFETLISEKDKKRWLIEDYKIAYVPSISSLREIIEHEKLSDLKPQKDILAFGDPYFGADEEEDSAEVLRLKYSGLEIERIAALFKKAKRNIFQRDEATEERLKNLTLTDYKILHFATHSVIDDVIPARSSIVFSLGSPSDEDEILQMREIFKLRLDSDLVTLSSCQTGLGQFIKGEGIDSLSRAFFYAGASSVLISLWAVHDQASSQFMERYYFHLLSSNSIMNSLQKTKLEMIGSGVLSHPFYWAGFVATGNSDKIVYPSLRKTLIFLILLLVIAGAIASFIILKKFFKT